jgi:hypothetical protein
MRPDSYCSSVYGVERWLFYILQTFCDGFAEFNTKLVKAIDIQNDALNEGAMFLGREIDIRVMLGRFRSASKNTKDDCR